jgi:hypothetical protein
MSDKNDPFGEALQDLRYREDLGFGPFDKISAKVRRLRYPDFLLIGAQKAGTTWLHSNLNYHPNVWLPPTKELNYFNEVYSPSADGWERQGRLSQVKAARDFFDAAPSLSARQQLKRAALDVIEEEEISDTWYGRIFAHAPAEDLCGESSPDYCSLPRGAIAHIASLNPALKAVLLLRDPIDRFWSHVRMAVRDGYGEATLEFLQDSYTWRTYGGRSNYSEMLRRWRSMLGDERVVVLNYDWIAEDPARLLRTVTAHLGLGFDERFFPHAAATFGGGHDAAMPDEIYDLAKARMRHVYDDLLAGIPEMATPWYKRHFVPAAAGEPDSVSQDTCGPDGVISTSADESGVATNEGEHAHDSQRA